MGSKTCDRPVCGLAELPSPADLCALRRNTEMAKLRQLRQLRRRAGVADGAEGDSGRHASAEAKDFFAASGANEIATRCGGCRLRSGACGKSTRVAAEHGTRANSSRLCRAP